MNRYLLATLTSAFTVMVGMLLADTHAGATGLEPMVQGYIATILHGAGFVACVAFGALLGSK